jgi:DNA-binding MarR family transcriptional regulator
MNRKTYTKQASACHCMNLRRASLAISQVYDEFLAPSGLKISQYLLVKQIKRLGPVSVSNLALEIRKDRTTVVRNLKPLEDRGLIIDTSAKHSRDRQLKVTDKGFEILEKAELFWLAAQDFIEEYLGKDDMETLTALLSKIEALVP